MPLVIVAFTLTVPTAVVVKVLPLIVAPVVPALSTVHTIVLFVAFDGLTVAVNANGTPAVAVAGTSVMLDTGICDCDEVTDILKLKL